MNFNEFVYLEIKECQNKVEGRDYNTRQIRKVGNLFRIIDNLHIHECDWVLCFQIVVCENEFNKNVRESQHLSTTTDNGSTGIIDSFVNR